MRKCIHIFGKLSESANFLERPEGIEPYSAQLGRLATRLTFGRFVDNRAGYKVRRHRFDVAAQFLALFYWSRFVSRVPVAPTKAGFPEVHCKPKSAPL